MSNNLRFVRHIEHHKPAAPIMPAVHTTNVAALANIISTGTIELKQCKFYHKDLLYFFYGKPAYKILGRRNAASRIVGDAAVTFVFDISTMPEPHRLYALDTGAAFGERYDEFLPQGVDIEDFRLPSSPTTMSQLVSAFFGKNRNYFVGDPVVAVPPQALDVASQAYIDISRSAVAISFDDRACTCEIQFDVPIAVQNAKLITIVMPDRAFDDPEVKSALGTWGVKPVLYRMKRAFPSERTEVIYEKLGDFYEESGIL